MHYHRSLMARRCLVRIVVVLALVALIVILRLTVFRPDPVPVTVFIAARGRVEETVTNSKAGTVKTRHRARISPEIGGRVLEVLAKKGARVEAGQILARLDDTSYRTQVVNAERAFEAAREAEAGLHRSGARAARLRAPRGSRAEDRLRRDARPGAQPARRERRGVPRPGGRARTSSTRRSRRPARSSREPWCARPTASSPK
jgi:HlyD family secretion protein